MLQYLCCPGDNGTLLLHVGREGPDGHIYDGRLTCETCGASYPIHKGVPRLLSKNLSTSERQTQARFGFEWQWYRETGQKFGMEFWDYLKPLGEGDLRGKVVIDAGCGNGRFALEAAVAGARDVLAVDLSDSVEVAFEAGRAVPNLHIVQGSLMALPIKGGVDVTYCVGVLHHLEDPQRGFVELVNRLAPGGRIAVWVYSAEGNEWFVRFVEPLRRCLTSKLSPSLVQVLALPMAGILWLGALITRGYFGKRLRLPLHNYLRFQGQFGFRYLFSLCLTSWRRRRFTM